MYFSWLARKQGKQIGTDGSQGGQHQTDSKIVQILDAAATREGYSATVITQRVKNLLAAQAKIRQDTKGKYNQKKTDEFRPKRDK